MLLPLSNGHSADGATTVQRWAAAALERLVVSMVAGVLVFLLLLRLILLQLYRPCRHCTSARHCPRGLLRSRLMLTLCGKWVGCRRRWSLQG